MAVVCRISMCGTQTWRSSNLKRCEVGKIETKLHILVVKLYNLSNLKILNIYGCIYKKFG